VEPLDVIRAISDKTGTIGSLYYFHHDTMARGAELGLDGFRFYFLGRGGALGDVDAAVVRSAFGYFHPSLVAKMWNSGRERCDPRLAARAHLECNAALGRTALADVDGLDAYGDAARAVVDTVDESALTLFAAIRTEPVPTDTAGRAMHYAVLLRELRGSAHLAAVRVCGLESAVAHAVARPGDVELFGYTEPIEVTDEDRQRLESAESLTEQMLVPAFSVLDDAGAAALVAGTEAMFAALTS
jgi:hypothetical protein